MAKYEAGQLWVSGELWALVCRASPDDEWVFFVASGDPMRVRGPILADAFANKVAKGYTLSNPRGLREAAAAMLAEHDAVSQVPYHAAKALRTALEGSEAAKADAGVQ